MQKRNVLYPHMRELPRPAERSSQRSKGSSMFWQIRPSPHSLQLHESWPKPVKHTVQRQAHAPPCEITVQQHDACCPRAVMLSCSYSCIVVGKQHIIGFIAILTLLIKNQFTNLIRLELVRLCCSLR